MNRVLIIVLFCLGISCANNKLTQQSTIKGYYTVIERSKVSNSRIIGYVKDKETGKVLPLANVSIGSSKNVGTITDEKGFFTLEIAPGRVQINVSNVGNVDLKTKPLRIGVNEQLEIEFYLGTYVIK